jgi:hypothetical protein
MCSMCMLAYRVAAQKFGTIMYTFRKAKITFLKIFST